MSADRNVASGQFGPQVQVHEYEGTEGHRDHITRSEYGPPRGLGPRRVEITRRGRQRP